MKTLGIHRRLAEEREKQEQETEEQKTLRKQLEESQRFFKELLQPKVDDMRREVLEKEQKEAREQKENQLKNFEHNLTERINLNRQQLRRELNRRRQGTNEESESRAGEREELAKNYDWKKQAEIEKKNRRKAEEDARLLLEYKLFLRKALKEATAHLKENTNKRKRFDKYLEKVEGLQNIRIAESFVDQIKIDANAHRHAKIRKITKHIHKKLSNKQKTKTRKIIDKYFDDKNKPRHYKTAEDERLAKMNDNNIHENPDYSNWKRNKNGFYSAPKPKKEESTRKKLTPFSIIPKF
jgi:hypothetical protein